MTGLQYPHSSLASQNGSTLPEHIINMQLSAATKPPLPPPPPSSLHLSKSSPDPATEACNTTGSGAGSAPNPSPTDSGSVQNPSSAGSGTGNVAVGVPEAALRSTGSGTGSAPNPSPTDSGSVQNPSSAGSGTGSVAVGVPEAALRSTGSVPEAASSGSGGGSAQDITVTAGAVLASDTSGAGLSTVQPETASQAGDSPALVDCDTDSVLPVQTSETPDTLHGATPTTGHVHPAQHEQSTGPPDTGQCGSVGEA
ncbi:hypothetical protein BaRGS_00008442, partial [Batillaria attramentaria]